MKKLFAYIIAGILLYIGYHFNDGTSFYLSGLINGWLFNSMWKGRS